MKKTLILGSAALTLTLSLGLAAPTFATTTPNASVTATPTYSEISHAISEAKNLSQYNEYASLVQAVQSASVYRMQSAIAAIDGSIVTSGLSATELTKIATSLPRYQAYKYLYNLVNYTEHWLNTSYYGANSADKQEAYDAISDAVISCRLLFPTKPSTAQTPKTTTQTPQSSVARVAEPTATPQVPTTVAPTTEETTVVAPVNTQSSQPTVQALANSEEDYDAGVQISVMVVSNPDIPAAAEENLNNEDKNDSTIATNLTYAATTFSIAGAALATKREAGRSNRKLHRI